MTWRMYGSLTTYLDDSGALMLLDATGAVRRDGIDVVDELASLRGRGWQLVQIETGEAQLPGRANRRVLMTSYLLER